MSRPRTPFGPVQPGRIAGTMVRVLATEMSDPARLTRGKRYWSEHAVLDLVVGHGAVTAEVQGSRPLPYVVTIETRPGQRAPSRRDVRVRCTCPDDDGTGRSACKHAVAAMFALADEISIEPEILLRWRRSDAPVDTWADTGDPGDGDRDADDRDADDRDDERRDDESRDDEDGDVDDDDSVDEAALLAALLAPTPGPRLPPLPTLSAAEHPRVTDDLLADVLHDALTHLRIRWD